MKTAKSRSEVWSALGAVCLIVLSLPFVLYAMEKGLSFSDPDERATTRLFDENALVAGRAIYLHMIAGGVITALAPMQMLGVIRRNWPLAHRASGYLIAVTTVATALAGLFYITLQGTIGGAVMNVGFSLYGVLMIVAAFQTVRYARMRDVRHRLWAGRLIILALASWLYRVHYGIWEIATGGLGVRSDFSGPFDLAQVFAFYLPYLMVHHIWWHRCRRK